MPRKFRPKSFRLSPEVIQLVSIASHISGVSETDIVEACIRRQFDAALGDVMLRRELVRVTANVRRMVKSLQSGPFRIVNTGDKRTAGRSAIQKNTATHGARALDEVKIRLSRTASGDEPIEVDNE